MYKSFTKTRKYSELETHETLKIVASANAISKHYKSSSLITVKRHAMVLSFLKANLVYFNCGYVTFLKTIRGLGLLMRPKWSELGWPRKRAHFTL